MSERNGVYELQEPLRLFIPLRPSVLLSFFLFLWPDAGEGGREADDDPMILDRRMPDASIAANEAIIDRGGGEVCDARSLAGSFGYWRVGRSLGTIIK